MTKDCSQLDTGTKGKRAEQSITETNFIIPGLYDAAAVAAE